jgi:hypothetical protein
MTSLNDLASPSTLRALVEQEDFARHFTDKESIDGLFSQQTVPQFVS